MNRSLNSDSALKKPWRIRAAQLDLARQRETLDSIGQFIRFIKDWGYNTLVLYLEGVVRTRSFPYRPKNQSYSLDDMRRVVQMATEAGIEVVPCIATLGHTEQFLSCKQLAYLREITALTNQLMFCPSNDAVYEFLERYLAEIASVFPSRHFHIGCDEAWPLGTCPACHDRLVRGETHEDLFIKHIRRCRGILQKLGKRTWIWDDMLENATEEKFKEVPRDIVMCAWHYGHELVDYGSLPGHFNNLRRRDWLAFYEAAGFDVIVSPAASFENPLAMTQIARQHRVLGGLQTMWELSTAFLPTTLPAVALGGALWSQPYRSGEKALQEVLQQLFPSVDSTVRAVLRATPTDAGLGAGNPPDYYLRGPMTMGERRGFRASIVYERLLRSQLERLPAGLERDIVEDWHTGVRAQILAGRQRELLPALVDPRIRIADRPAQRKMAEWCLKEMDAIAEFRAKQWKRYRPGIALDHASASWRDLKKGLAAFFRDVRRTPSAKRALLNLRLFLWDGYSWPRLTIELCTNGKWRTISNTTYKSVNLRDALFNIQVPVKWTDPDPDRIRFTVSLFGGQGISYAELYFADRALVPAAVSGAGGEVSNPLALLMDDSSVCYLGHPDTAHTYDTQTESAKSWIEATLASKKKLSGPSW